MSEQGLSDENSPAVAGPDQGDTGTAEQNSQQPAETQAEIDWQKRYVDTQDAYRQGQEAIKQYERLLSSDDPDERREAALALGYEFDEEPEPESDDPVQALNERLARIEESMSQQDQQAQQAEVAEQVFDFLEDQMDQLKVDEDDRHWVLSYALHVLPDTEDGLPDVQQAYQVFQARENERQKTWARSKQAPHFAPHGQPATEVPDLDNRQQRQDWMTRRLMENETP